MRNFISGLALLLCASGAVPAWAQPAASDYRVLVIGEDADPRAVPRGSALYRSVMAELKAALMNRGFRVLDEDAVSARAGWRFGGPRTKDQILDGIALANGAGDAAVHSRVVALVRLYGLRTYMGFATRAETRALGELYDAHTRQFLGSFEMPPQAYPTPAQCFGPCVNEVLAGQARDIGASLGHVLAAKLEYLIGDAMVNTSATTTMAVPPGESAAAAVPTTSGPAEPADLPTTYGLALRNFTVREVLRIVSVMEAEFPGYVSHNLLQQMPMLSKFEYVSRAKAVNLDDWIKAVLVDMGFGIGTDVAVIWSDSSFTVDRILPAAAAGQLPPATPRRFQ